MEQVNKITLNNYYILSTVLLGNNLKITFQNGLDIHDRKVLELNGIAGFIDTPYSSKELTILRIHNVGGVYATDLSMRLRKPQIQNFPEVFIFTDNECIDFCFRAVAETIEFREWEYRDNWLQV